jgi:hypothetical protein
MSDDEKNNYRKFMLSTASMNQNDLLREILWELHEMNKRKV